LATGDHRKGGRSYARSFTWTPSDCVNRIKVKVGPILLDPFGGSLGTTWHRAHALVSHGVVSPSSLPAIQTVSALGMGEERSSIACLRNPLSQQLGLNGN
jgi:hypothetical protein